MTLDILVGVLILGGVIYSIFFWRSLRKIEKDYEIRKQELMSEITKFKEEVTTTKKEELFPSDKIEELEKNLHKLVDDVLDQNLDAENMESRIKEIKQQSEEVKQETERHTDRKEKLMDKAKNEVEKFKDFVDGSNFYPADFLYEAKRLEGKILDVKEAKPKDLSEAINILDRALYKFHKDFNKFSRIHKEISTWLKGRNSATSNEKQELFFLLHQGELDKASKMLKTLKSKK